ncbi:MAG: sigma-70 region 4 domain-containing protein [Deltaproteobacteria bacterium]|nr:sigma-70 region 4 domain-containing protein [Deltaproteobacteria bacterium]
MLQINPSPVTGPAASQDYIESLVTHHFQPIYALVDAFLENPHLSLKLTETFFKIAEMEPPRSSEGLYRMVMESIDFQNCDCALLELLTFDTAACWLLKDLGGFRYGQIGDILGMSSTQVKENIAQARAVMMLNAEVV